MKIRKNACYPTAYLIAVALTVFFMWCVTTPASSQDVQLWLDGYLYKELAEAWEYTGNVGSHRLLKKQGWSDTYICNTFSWDVKTWFNAHGGLDFHETVDPLGPDIREIRPWLGQTFTLPRYFRRIHLEDPYGFLRWEQRFMRYPEGDTSDFKSRLRIRVGCRFLLNNTSMVEKTFYVPVYFEGFVNINGLAIEKYASQYRSTVGLGYIINQKWRSELNFYALGARNTADEKGTRTDIVFQIKVKYYITRLELAEY